MRPPPFAAAALALLMAFPAWAQDNGDDWEFVQRGSASAASVSFDNGIAVAIRCDGQSLETYIVGLTPADRRVTRRTIDYAFGDAPLRESSWQVSRDGQVLFADLPAPLARRFRAGGDLQLRLPAAGDTPARRHVMSLPPSPAAIDRVLGACGRPAVDPRDALRRDESSSDTTPEAATGGLRWNRLPRPAYPDRALEAGVSGMTVLSCLTTEEGRLEDCQVEVERPAGADFGRNALRATREARLRRPDAAAAAGGIVSFTILWNLP